MTDSPLKVSLACATPAERWEILEASKAIYEFSQFCDRVDPTRIGMAILGEHVGETRTEVSVIRSWLERFAAVLAK